MKVSKLLNKSSKWCKGAWAKDETGGTVLPWHSTAAKYSLLGAIQFCYGHPVEGVTNNGEIEETTKVGEDGRTFEDVQAEVQAILNIDFNWKKTIESWNDGPATFVTVSRVIEGLNL
jgi:hypothetical protein